MRYVFASLQLVSLECGPLHVGCVEGKLVILVQLDLIRFVDDLGSGPFQAQLLLFDLILRQ